MSPSMKIGDVCKAENVENSLIQRFDIVVFNMPEDIKKITGEKGNIKIISRIIGLPGEKIEIRQGKAYINNKLLDESFEKVLDLEKDFSAIEIPKNEYFLLGDNRPESLDSRYWKKPTVSREEISGKISGCSK
jgi:signal peptidase I